MTPTTTTTSAGSPPSCRRTGFLPVRRNIMFNLTLGDAVRYAASFCLLTALCVMMLAEKGIILG